MEAGSAKVKVALRKKQYVLQGYGSMNHTANAVESDLHARAFIFRNNSKIIVLLSLECAFISHHLKEEVLFRFQREVPDSGVSENDFLFTANSTHSAPGGYSHYAAFNITTGGFRRDVFEMYVNACVKALREAYAALSQVSCFLNASYFKENDDVAFNRSLEAYNQNPDMEKQDEEHTHLAVNRLVRQLVLRRSNQQIAGIINWFGVQGTSIPATSSRIHPDNKGFAASLLESDQSHNPEFVAAFCVEAAGDVSPNHHGNVKRWPRGKYEDPFKSAYFNGFLQFEKAREMLEDEDLQIELGDTIDSVLHYVDFSQVICDPLYTSDGKSQQTAEAISGLESVIGDEIDHDGLDAFSAMLLRQFIRTKAFFDQLPLIRSKLKRARNKRLNDAHGNKLRLIDFQNKTVLGFSNFASLPLPYMPSDVTGEMKRQFKNGALREHTWKPVILPLQIIRIGELAVLGVPGEISTAAGIRLRQSMQLLLEPQGILDVIITSLSNEHGGYFTTAEEYEVQAFEGASTLFGKNSLAALQTEFGKLAAELSKPPSKRRNATTPVPPQFSETELNLRSAAV